MKAFFKKNKTVRNILYGVGSIVLLIVLSAFILLSQLLVSVRTIVINRTPVDILSSEYMNYVSKGGTWILDDSDLNAISQIVVKAGTTVGPLTIQSIFVELEGDIITVCATIKAYGGVALVKSDVKITDYEGYVLVQPHSLKVGNISFPIKLVFDYAKQYLSQFEWTQDGIKIPKSELPSKLLNLSIENSGLSLVWETPVVVKPQDPITGTPETPVVIPQPTATVKDLLISTNKQLVTVESKASTQAEKNLISSIRISIGKVINDEKYNITGDVAAVKVEYGALTTEERSELKTLILTYMSTKNLLKLQEMFNL